MGYVYVTHSPTWSPLYPDLGKGDGSHMPMNINIWVNIIQPVLKMAAQAKLLSFIAARKTTFSVDFLYQIQRIGDGADFDVFARGQTRLLVMFFRKITNFDNQGNRKITSS